MFEHVPKVQWTRHFCLALIAKAFLHMLNQSSHEFSDASKQRQRDTGTTWNNCLYVLFFYLGIELPLGHSIPECVPS